MFRRKSDLNSACDAPGGDFLPSCACVNFTALSLGSRSVPVSSIDHTYTSTQKKHDVVFVVGPPGAGKGTQCARIQQVKRNVRLPRLDEFKGEMNRSFRSMASST